MKLLLHDFVTRINNSEVTRLTAADCRCCMGRMDAQIYQNEGWVSWADWLGYGEGKPQRARVSFLPFEQARALVRLQGFSMAAQVRAGNGLSEGPVAVVQLRRSSEAWSRG